jgi:tetratricopeptide (TPR) repeat protein
MAADVRRTRLGQIEEAIELYQQVIDEEEASETVVLKVARRLNDLLSAAGRVEERLAVLERLAKIEPEAADRRAIVGQVARAADELGDVSRALSSWQRRLADDAADLEALDAMVDILTREERFADLVSVLDKRALAATVPFRRRADLVRKARVERERLSDVSGAIATWTLVAEEFGEDPETVDALAELLSTAERWDDVSELLGRAADREADHVASIYARIGDVQREQMKQLAFATEAYESALRIDPGFEAARQGLTLMLNEDELRGPASESLASAYGLTDEWQAKLDLLPARLRAADSSLVKVRLYREAAKIQEDRAEDLGAALASMRQAMALAPELRDIEADVFRLAEATGQWSVAIDAIRDAVQTLGEDAPRSRYLRFWEGRLVEEHLGDPEAALAAFGKVFEGEPTRADAAVAVVRTAGKSGRWGRAAEALVRSSRANEAISDEVREAVEHAADAAGAWGEIASALEGSVGSADSIEPRLACELEVLSAEWHERRRSDLDSAQSAYTRAVQHDDTHLPTLSELARLQRRSGGRPLYDTLMRMADLVEEDLDPLREATEVALNGMNDRELGRTTAERLYRESTRLWRRGATTGGETQPEPTTRWALDQLVAVHEQDEAPLRSVALLADAALLPVGTETSLEWRRRAADIAAGSGDNARAIVLYRGILDESPNDTEVLGALASVCEKEDRLPEMMALISHELKLTEDIERRLAIRLDLARLVGEFERRGGRVEALEANLVEQPGHEPSIEAIIEVLEGGRRYGQLADVLTDQASRLETEGEAKRAARLWAKVASLAEDRLEDVDRALDAHRKVVELAATPGALDALARLHIDRGQHAAAAQWLERRLSVAEDEERTDVAVSLAQAHLGAGQVERAITVLEQALENARGRSDVRDMLAAQYRATSAIEPLAALLTTAGAHVDDDETLLAYAREASDLFTAIDQPDRAIPVLERAAARATKDRDIRTRLAEGLLRGERYDEAADILDEVISGYGRRRNADRAASHHQLARVHKARGDMDAALEQLELASKMDVSNPVILRALGEMSHDAGDHDRAERAYRALLLIVRRQKPEDLKVGASEVQYELGRIAKARGDEETAEELFESALETAKSNDVEAERLERTLVHHGEHELALRALEGRLELSSEDASRARLLGRLGALLDAHLDRGADGLSRYLEALDHDATDAALHAAARDLARRTGASDEYAKKLTALAKAADAPETESDLLLRLGEVTEVDLDNKKRAKKHFKKAEELGVRVTDAWKALARVASALGDTGEELRVLSKLVSAGEDVTTPGERVDAMFRLAEVQLERPDHRDDGVETITQALDFEPRNSIAAGVLKITSDEAPDHTGVLRVYERVARGSGEPLFLLDFFEKRAQKEDATLGEVREGVELATEHEDGARAERLLERAVEIARRSDDGLAGALWVPTQLAQLRRAAGDMAGAIRWYNEAADAAGDERGYELRIEAATLAAEDDSGLDLAAEPLLEVHRRRGDEDRLNDIVAATVDALLDPALRNQARMEKVRFLLAREGREPDAADALRAVLDEEPEHAEAGKLLADLFEKTGYDEDLVDLLSRQLDIARDNQDLDQIRDLSLRLGGILEKVRREDAMDVYRRALDWVPKDRSVAQALLAQLGPEDDPRERIEVLERLLATESGDAAAKLSMELASEWERLEEPDGVQRALELGYHGCPENEAIRQRLEA